MIGDVQHFADIGRLRRAAAAMDFHAGLHAEVRGERGHFAPVCSDALDSLFVGFVIIELVWTHLDTGCAHVGGQLRILLGPFDVLAQFIRVFGLKLEGGTQARKFDAAVGEERFDLLAFLGRELDLDTVLVGRAEFDAR